MSVSAAIRRMLEAGLTIEQALVAAEAFEAESAPVQPVLSARQARNKRYYDSKKASKSRLNSDDQDVSDDSDDSDGGAAPPSDKENPPNPLKKLTTTQTSSLRSDVPARAPSKPTPRSELLVVLDANHADAVIEHRQKIRKPISAHAAKLLAAKFAQCASPNEAADAMIANGWQGFEPQWLESRSFRQSQAPPRERTVLDAVNDRLREEDAARYEPPTIDHEPLSGPATAADLRFPSASQGRRW